MTDCFEDNADYVTLLKTYEFDKLKKILKNYDFNCNHRYNTKFYKPNVINKSYIKCFGQILFEYTTDELIYLLVTIKHVIKL